MYDFLKDNYGTIGEAWIEKIRTNIDYIKKKHKEVTHSLDSLKDKLHSHIQYMSIMLLTDELVSEYFFKEEKCNFEKVKLSLQTFDEADIISKAYEHMKSWVMSNYNKFKTDSIIRYGTITDGEAWIYPNIFEEELKKSGYPVLKVKKKFAEKGIMSKGTDGKYTVNKRIDNMQTRMIIFKLECEYDKDIPEEFLF